MKLLYLTNLPAPYRVAFFNELGKQVDLTVLYQRKTASDRDKRWQADTANTFHEVYLGGVQIGAAASFSPGVISFLKDPAYDAIIIGGYSTPTELLAISYLKHKHIPYLLSVDGGVPTADNPCKRFVKTHAIRGAALYLTTGKTAENCLLPYGADETKFRRYHFTSLWEKDIKNTPPTREEKQRKKQALGLGDGPIVLSVGRIMPLKRYDLLIHTAKQMPHVQFVIVGGVIDAFHQELRTKNHVTNVTFIDFLDYARLTDYYIGADVFVMPSDADVWGLVIGEAMANGLPVLVSDRCGAAETLIKEHKNGCVFSHGNQEELQNRLSVLLADETCRNQYAAESLAVIKEYTIENEVCDVLRACTEFCHH